MTGLRRRRTIGHAINASYCRSYLHLPRSALRNRLRRLFVFSRQRTAVNRQTGFAAGLLWSGNCSGSGRWLRPPRELSLPMLASRCRGRFGSCSRHPCQICQEYFAALLHGQRQLWPRPLFGIPCVCDSGESGITSPAAIQAGRLAELIFQASGYSIFDFTLVIGECYVAKTFFGHRYDRWHGSRFVGHQFAGAVSRRIVVRVLRVLCLRGLRL